MRKINALVRYEILNLRRGKLIWIMAVLYAVGIQQVISNMYSYGSTFLSLVGLIQNSWLPLNFIAVPLLLLSESVGESKNEIFDTMDLSAREILLSKAATLAVLDGVILAVNLLIAVNVAVICRVSIGYFFYQMLGYTINTVIFLIACSSIGLFIGQVWVKYVGGVIAFFTVVGIFILTCNFYKAFNNIVPLINIRTIANKFDVISYDMGYVYHNVLWLMISMILLLIIYMNQSWSERSVKGILLQFCSLTAAIVVCSVLISGIKSEQPTFYDVGKRSYSEKEKRYQIDEMQTFFSKENCGYQVEKYTMAINMDKEFINNCEIMIRLNEDNVKTVELGLWEKLKISRIELNGEVINCDRTNNSIKLNLPEEYKKGELIKVNISYGGIINTRWWQGKQAFFVRNNALYLSDLFEWYPKLNDLSPKDFTINIKYTGKNKIFSNLKSESREGISTFQGTSTEVFLISGNIIERNYRGYSFIGNEEYVNNNKYCDNMINQSQRLNSGKVRRFALVPFNKSFDNIIYDGAYLQENP